eukprot:TRINITY_DN13914_c0_g1_i1.p1 TRINITY_DN13914_c0_g1~~TRINITY_DN13914_c0_g1_i1.p1  ORF type:complete len:277 (-),score=31.73 TRINITY_DN13914_c0_g1_i1:1-831(-)
MKVAEQDRKLNSLAGDPSFRGWKRYYRREAQRQKTRAVVQMIQDLKGTSGVGSAVQGIKSLTELDFSNTCLGSIGGKQLGVALEALRDHRHTLESMNLNNNQVRQEGATAILSSLAATPRLCLTTMLLTNNKLGPLGARAIADFLKANRTVRTLELSSNFLEDEGASTIAAGLEANSTVEYLGLADNQIMCKGATALAPRLGQLRKLDLKKNEIAKTGAGQLLDAFSRPGCKLNYLGLRDNKIGEKSIQRAVSLSSPTRVVEVDGLPTGGKQCVIC